MPSINNFLKKLTNQYQTSYLTIIFQLLVLDPREKVREPEAQLVELLLDAILCQNTRSKNLRMQEKKKKKKKQLQNWNSGNIRRRKQRRRRGGRKGQDAHVTRN
jgi:hypothetical protein